jgi:hypothetical protein
MISLLQIEIFLQFLAVTAKECRPSPLRPHHTPKIQQSPEVAFSNAMFFIVTLF